VPWRLVTLIREFCSEFNVLVPHRAFSAATLTALGADSVWMHPMGMLGPTDPSINGPLNPTNPLNPQQPLPVGVEDVASYIALVKDDVGIRHEDELVQTFLALADKVHPLTLGGVKRATSQSRMMGEKLLRRRGGKALSESAITEVIRKLTTELYFHGHPIGSREAKEDLGLDFVKPAPKAVADAMWVLYELYDSDMRMQVPFDATREAIAKSPLPVPAAAGAGMPVAPAQATVKLDNLRLAVIESAARSDAFETALEITLVRDFLGNYQAGQTQITAQEWVIEQEPPIPGGSAATP
jgi:hypothetical protein